MNLAQLAEDALQRLGERMALNFEGEPLTNTLIHDQGKRLQGAFEELGLKKDRVALMCMINHPLVIPTFQGIFRTGATAVPAMFQLTAPELHFLIHDTRAHVVFTDTFSLSKIREAVLGLDHVQCVVVREGNNEPDRTPPEIRMEDLVTHDARESFPNIDADDVAIMLYTSGTTGKPKGVMLTHTNLIASAEAAKDATEMDLWDVPRISLSAMPMAHIFGVAVMNSGYLIPERLADSFGVQHRWFEPEKFLAAIQEHKVNNIASVPTMLSLLMNHPKFSTYDLSSLRDVVCGAAPLPIELAKSFMDKTGARVREIYGMTENAGIGSANRGSKPFRPGSAGQPYFNTKVRIVDDDGNDVPTGERGEIVTQGPSTMKGYHNRPEETAKVIRNGWLHTGDIGHMDDEGWLYIVDRQKDMIIRGGENIYPAELEEVLYTHPDVAEAAVVGVPEPTYGEDVVAFVVLTSGSETTETDLINFMKQHVTRFKIPSRIEFIDSLPKSGVGKILRRVLRDKAQTSEREKV